jgi:hypothetical protein
MPQDDESLLFAIGRFTFEFSQLEYTFKHYLADILGLPSQHFDAVMSGYDFVSLCNIARDVFSRELGGDETAVLNDVVKRCLTLNQDRVRIMHGLWVLEGENRGVHHVSRQTQKPSLKFQSGDELQAKASLANKLRGELTSVILALPAFFKAAGAPYSK